MPVLLFPVVRRQTITSARQIGHPRLLRNNLPLPAVSISITGVSRDSAGAALGGCTVTLFKVSTQNGFPVFTQQAVMVSDGSGNYSFVVGADGPYRVTFDLDGAPIRAGLTLKSLAGV